MVPNRKSHRNLYHPNPTLSPIQRLKIYPGYWLLTAVGRTPKKKPLSEE